MLDYFGDMQMTKIKDENMYSFYYSKIATLLKNGNRYLIVIVNRDNNPLDSNLNLSSLQWLCLQTRTLDDFHNISKQQYIEIMEDFGNTIGASPITNIINCGLAVFQIQK